MLQTERRTNTPDYSSGIGINRGRVVLHVDLNNFFASVECANSNDPTLRQKPVAVCGDAENRHGIILAKNEIAKLYGVKTAETINDAKKKCHG
jgi:DNA polymerase-4